MTDRKNVQDNDGREGTDRRVKEGEDYSGPERRKGERRQHERRDTGPK